MSHPIKSTGIMDITERKRKNNSKTCLSPGDFKLQSFPIPQTKHNKRDIYYGNLSIDYGHSLIICFQTIEIPSSKTTTHSKYLRHSYQRKGSFIALFYE